MNSAQTKFVAGDLVRIRSGAGEFFNERMTGLVKKVESDLFVDFDDGSRWYLLGDISKKFHEDFLEHVSVEVNS